MIVVYAGEQVPESFEKSIFLAGPTPRSKDVNSWRPEALKVLEEKQYDGVVFVPEHREAGQEWRLEGYGSQIEWEEEYLNVADCILFWIPRVMATMPALTTNDEWGTWKNSGKVVLGAPFDAPHTSYQNYYAEKFCCPSASTLPETITLAIEMVGEGSMRTGGERYVPLFIWQTEHFQQWYKAQKDAGNRLDKAKVEWTFRVGPKKDICFFWILHVDIYIACEDRHKTNEVVLSRPDISSIVMYRKCRDNYMESDIVLVREFRSPARTADGFIWEVPGGSSFKPKSDMRELAADECFEETGLKIHPLRIYPHESRQLAGTLSAHKAFLFSVEISDEEFSFLKSREGIANGVADDTEQTYVEIMTARDLLEDNKADWTTIGMILSVIR